MLTIYSDDHHLHHGRCELMDGQLMPCFEMPSRADHVLQRVKERELGPVQAPQEKGDGDRHGGFRDAGGTTWWISTQVE